MTAQAKVEIVYDNKTVEKTVDVKGSLAPHRLLDNIDKAVEKAMGVDKAWRRWNLIDVRPFGFPEEKKQ